ncbi:hypothetical protein HYH02_012801 [Chlamydomonas schloesseri]|uniref:Uncharacterized protein n=1 Tax=Chlamydomonas schloesseri TaxID=2026947 RepID=A0A835SZS7_9CHLO|nr:hypothetical protein HYH02_012801 [Chlamydomonas schloesseri]|eukprot:KAG2433098.1 hypothetical protein HYH02_012801 [Chlamydomonas schloesseri]
MGEGEAEATKSDRHSRLLGEENFCRFCSNRLPALWKPDCEQSSPQEELKVAPVMAVRYNGPEGVREFKLRVKPGPEGLAMFKAHLRDVLGFDVGPEFDVTFECLMPATGSLVTLSGLNAYGAATHCAALLAAGKSGPSTPTAAGAATAGAAPAAPAAEAATAPAPIPAHAPRATAPTSPVAMPSTPQQPTSEEPAQRLAAPLSGLSGRRMCHSGYVPATPVAPGAQPPLLLPALPTAAPGFSSGTMTPAPSVSPTSGAATNSIATSSSTSSSRVCHQHQNQLSQQPTRPCPAAAAADRPRLGRVASDCALCSSHGSSACGSGSAAEQQRACGRPPTAAHSRRGAWDTPQRSLHASGAEDEEEDEILNELQARRLGALSRSPGTSPLSPASALPACAADLLAAAAAAVATTSPSLSPLSPALPVPVSTRGVAPSAWRRASIDVASGPGSPSNSPHASQQTPMPQPQPVRAVGYTAATPLPAPARNQTLGYGAVALPFSTAAGAPFRACPAPGPASAGPLAAVATTSHGSLAQCVLPASPVAVSRAASSLRPSSVDSSMHGGSGGAFSSGSLPLAPSSSSTSNGAIAICGGGGVGPRSSLASARSGRVLAAAEAAQVVPAMPQVLSAATAAAATAPLGMRAGAAFSPTRLRLPEVLKSTARRTVDCLLRVLRHTNAPARQRQ